MTASERLASSRLDRATRTLSLMRERATMLQLVLQLSRQELQLNLQRMRMEEELSIAMAMSRSLHGGGGRGNGEGGGDDEDGFELIDLEELRRPLGIEQDVLDEKAPQSSYASAVARDRKLHGPLSKLPGGNECAVCQGAMDGLEPVRLLPCRHCFHADCIEPWLKRSTQCPSCRADVSKEE